MPSNKLDLSNGQPKGANSHRIQRRAEEYNLHHGEDGGLREREEFEKCGVFPGIGARIAAEIEIDGMK